MNWHSCSCSVGLKVKVTLGDQMTKWPYIELVWVINPTFTHGFQNNLA